MDKATKEILLARAKEIAQRDGGAEVCTCCGRALNALAIAWLDLNNTTGKYRVECWPTSESQGLFPFGMSCAARLLKQ